MVDKMTLRLPTLEKSIVSILVLVHAYTNLDFWFSALQVLYLHLSCKLEGRGKGQQFSKKGQYL